MTKFIIKYRDPETGEDAQTEAEFSDAAGIPARDWAEDYAYSLADKGHHTVEPQATAFACSPPVCIDGEHKMDGPRSPAGPHGLGLMLEVRRPGVRCRYLYGRRVMLITGATWDRIRLQFTEDEKKLLRAHVTGETICPRGMVVDETALPAALATRLKMEKETVKGK